MLIPFCKLLLNIRFCRSLYEVSTWHAVFGRNGNTLSRDVLWRPLRKSWSLSRSFYLAKNPHPFSYKYLCVHPLWLIIIHKNFSFCSIFLNFQIHFIKNLGLLLLLTIDPILKLWKIGRSEEELLKESGKGDFTKRHCEYISLVPNTLWITPFLFSILENLDI